MRFAFLLCLAVPLFAQSEICRFRAGDAVNPFQRWLASQQVTCEDATKAVPPGRWNVFVRGTNALSSPVFVEGTFDPSSLPTAPAATIALQLPDGHGGVVYVPRRAIAFPVTGARVQVPAGEELWLIVLEKSRVIVSIVPIPAIEAGAERAVDARSGGVSSSILGWLQVAEGDRAAIRNSGDVQSPTVYVMSAGPAREADPLPWPAFLDGAFVLVRGVSAGNAELEIAGRGWLPHRTRAKVESRVITIAKEPLLVRPAASLIVNWSGDDGDLLALDRSLGSCDSSKDKPPLFEISVSACAKPKHPDDPVDPTTCRLVRQETFGPEVPYGSFAVDDIPPGIYRVEMSFGRVPPVSTMVSAVAMQQRSVRIRAIYLTMYGSLTRGGEPLEHDATIAFPGDGAGFASQETGEYRAVLKQGVETDDQINVTECEGGLRTLVLADQPGGAHSRFDIDIPDNTLAINVTDTFTQMSLPAASLRYVVLSKNFPKRPVITRVLTPDEHAHGRFVLKAVPEREIHLTVSHGGYEKYIVKPFTMPKSEKKTIDVQMVPLRGSRGRIVSPVPFDDGSLGWYTQEGKGIEQVDLGPDGTFVYERSHEPGETMVVVSRSHPLWIFRAPAVDPRQTLEVRFPDAPIREFEVTILGADTRTVTPVGIVVGGMMIPSGALDHHQTLRERRMHIRGSGSMMFRDFAETGPIDVFAGALDSPRKRLTSGVTELVFELK